MRKIGVAMARPNSKASDVYLAVMSVQVMVAVCSAAVSLAFSLAIRFAMGREAHEAFLWSMVVFLFGVILFYVLGSWAVYYVITLGDDAFKRRDKLGRFEAERMHVDKLMRGVETAVPHRARSGQLVGYMVGDKYLSVEQIKFAIDRYSGEGGFSYSKKAFDNEVK